MSPDSQTMARCSCSSPTKKRKIIAVNSSETQTKTKRRRKRTLSLRTWSHSPRDLSCYNDRVIIVSYNILGVENAEKHPQLYRGVSQNYLDWEYRKKRLYKEVKGYKASILCFQEVDHFDDLNELLGKDGYRGLHKTRTGEAKDGCAIFWKARQFTLLHEETIEFQRFGLRNNVAQFCVLKWINNEVSHDDATSRSMCSTTSRSILVGNIHVLYNPKRGDIKLGQMRMFLEKAYEISQEWGSIPVVIAGDFNSLPESAMYEFLASSTLHIQHHDRRQISGPLSHSEYPISQHWNSNHIKRAFSYRWTDEEIMLATVSRFNKMQHLLKLCRAYAEIPGNRKVRDQVGEPLATSYHCLFTGTVDYIWHTPELVPVRVLETLSMRKLKKTGYLPSKKWGSDHLALVCELAIADNGSSD